MKGIECVVAMLGGAAMGAAVALLLAPCDGKQMREQLCEMMRQKCHACNCDTDDADLPAQTHQHPESA